MRRPQALIVPPRVMVPRTWLMLLVTGWSQVSLYLGTDLWSRVSVSLLPGSISLEWSPRRGRPAEGPGRSRGNGNASLYYKSRPEGAWGSPHDSIELVRVRVDQPDSHFARQRATGCMSPGCIRHRFKISRASHSAWNPRQARSTRRRCTCAPPARYAHGCSSPSVTDHHSPSKNRISIQTVYNSYRHDTYFIRIPI